MEWRNSAARRTIQDLNKILLESGRFSDVSFIVGSDKVPINSHTFILITRSPVFEAMFSSAWADSAQRVDDKFIIAIPDTYPDAFRGFLKFLYTDSTDAFSTPLDILYLGQKYDVVELVTICTAFLTMSLQVSTVFGIHKAAKLFDLEELQQAAFGFMLKNASSFIEHPDFRNLDEDTLCDLVSNDALQLDEIVVFKSLLMWGQAECERRELLPSGANYRTVLGKIIPFVRFPLMAPQDFSTEIVNSGVLKSEEIIALFLHFNVKTPEKKRTLELLPFNASPRLYPQDGNIAPEFRCLLPSIFSAGLYLSSESCCPNGLSYTMGNLGKVYEESLDFTVGRTIEILGIGLYGPSPATLLNDKSYKHYSVELSLVSHSLGRDNQLQRTPIARASRLVRTRDDYEVHFQYPVRAANDKLHHIQLAFKGEETKHGFTRLSNVSTTCKGERVTFNFLGPIGTPSCHPQGRIRSIVFTTM